MPEIELFTSKLCPFAHRVQLALLQKEIDFWHTEIDLADKPEWFLVIAPLGEVPVIRHEDRFVANSSVILEYLEDVYPAPSLRPSEPGKLASCRFWMRYADDRLAPAIEQCIGAETPDAQAASASELRERLTFIEREGLARCGRGPFWLGRDPSILDFAFYPFFERLPAIQQLRPVALPLMSIRLRYWLDAMRDLDSVKATRHPVESYAEAIHGSGSLEASARSGGGKVEYLHA
jgi:glutathione S-transferase